jgi:hypothetical protein
MLNVTTREWVFTAAQTDQVLIAVGASQYMSVTYVDATCANSNSVDVAVRIGFHATALPAFTNNSLTGVDGIVFTHGGIARGGGEVKANGGKPITIGQVGEDLRLTCTVPTGGDLHLLVGFVLNDV